MNRKRNHEKHEKHERAGANLFVFFVVFVLFVVQTTGVAMLVISRRALALAAALSLTAGAAAAQTAPKWVVDPAHSALGFESTVEGQGFEGRFKSWDADIRFDPKALAASRVVVTVETGSIVSGDAQRDQTAQTGEWFASAMFPKATFTTTSIKDLGGGKYEAAGNLTIRDKTQPVSFPFALDITGDQAKLTGETTVDRSLFGVGQGDYGGPDTVPLEVKVKVELTASRAK
jgi:polyisoprenoid-binding protein YceI